MTIELEDDEAAWLERWKVFHPAAPHRALTLEQKVAACVFRVWSVEEAGEMRAELETDERHNTF